MLGFALRGVHSIHFDKCVLPCIYHISIILVSFTALKILCSAYLCPHSSAPGSNDCFIISLVFTFSTCRAVGIGQCVAFPEWLLPLRNRRVRFLRVFSRFDVSFLFSVEPYSMVWMDPAICPSDTVEHLDCFQILAIMNKAAINICLCGDINIHLSWINTKEHDCWILRSEYVQCY